MNADHFRQLYNYHFGANRKLWDRGINELTDAQFKQKLPYSTGSIRNQAVHMMNMDERWFCALCGVQVPGLLNPVYISTRAALRERWDKVEVDILTYLAQLTDSHLSQPVEKNLVVWQALFHVLNHGTDHRAQTLSMLHQLGIRTFPQDYALFAYGKM